MIQHSLSRFVLLALLLAFPSIARGAEYAVVEEHWYELLIDDAKIGWMSVLVEDDGERFRTKTESFVKMVRAGEPVEIRSASSFIEDRAGTPIRCRSTQRLSLQESVSEYVFDAEGVAETSGHGAARTTRRLPRPDGVWFAPAAADRYARERRAAGAKEFAYRMLEPDNGIEPIAVRSVAAGKGEYDVKGRTIPVTIWKTTTDLLPRATTEYYSSDGHLVFQELTSGIGRMITRLADKRIATDFGDGAVPELMLTTFVRSDRPIPRVHRARRATLRLRVKDGAMPHLPSAASQRVEPGADESRVVLHVDLDGALPATDAERADPAYLATSSMVNTEDPLVGKLADRATRKVGDGALARSTALRTHVARHITRKGFDTAFASAAETARTRRGDCSEHAVLLCAMLRSEGIPARVASGLVYIDEFGGARDVFGWHMWTQALIDGHWVDFDATLPGRYHAGHVLVGTSSLADSGAAGDLTSMLLLIGNLEIEVGDVGYEAEAPASR